MDKAFWEEKLAPFLAQLQAAGSDQQCIIDPASVVTAPWVRYKCQFGCGKYGKSPLCPPNTPSYTETRAILDAYSLGILYRVRSSRPGNGLAGPILRALGRAGYYKAIAFDDAPCCSLEKGQPLPQPTLEACGVDVLASARNNGFRVELAGNADGSWDCFGLILVE
ncbi:MAG: DUF2284 domain-containing protein [Bacillota bacterium]|nr:DUF2284 domain-containing protein [Bacillota bacterium]